MKAAVAACGDDFTFDEDYSQLTPDERMPVAFEASLDRFSPTVTDEDRDSIQSHTAVAYILSPPMPPSAAESVSARTLRLTATLLSQGGLAAKSESAGLAHGRSHWLELARRYSAAADDSDPHTAAAMLYRAWVQRAIHDPSASALYSVGMHLLGHRDTEVDDSPDLPTALEWIDLMGLYLVADKPDRPVLAGEGFRLRDEGPRRIIRQLPCRRYEEDDFFHNPYGYNRLVSDHE